MLQNETENLNKGFMQLGRLLSNTRPRDISFAYITDDNDEIKLVVNIFSNGLIYLPQVAQKMDISEETLLHMLTKSLTLNPTFTISIPIKQIKNKCYCAYVFPEKEHFLSGIITFNDWVQAPIHLTEIVDINRAMSLFEIFSQFVMKNEIFLEDLEEICPKKNSLACKTDICSTCIRNSQTNKAFNRNIRFEGGSTC